MKIMLENEVMTMTKKHQHQSTASKARRDNDEKKVYAMCVQLAHLLSLAKGLLSSVFLLKVK